MKMSRWKLLIGVTLVSAGCSAGPGGSGDEDVPVAVAAYGLDASGDADDARPDAVSSDAALPDAPADVARPDAVSPDATAPDAPADVARPDAESPDATAPDAPADVARMDAVSPDATAPDAPADVARMDAVSPDVIAPPDAPADVARMDAVSPDVIAPPDAPADIARTDAVSPDVIAPPDAPADAPSGGTVPPDPVGYSGTLPVRTTGSAFTVRLTVRLPAGGTSARDVTVLLPRVLPAGAPLVLGFHGTNSDGATMLSESGASAVADAQGVIFIAPTARWFGGEGADFDHPGGNGTYWETDTNPNPGTNEDLLLVRAIIQEARRAYGVDPARVYAYGHSNGGFMAFMVSQVLRDRVVGFGANSAGLSRCNPQQACRFQGSGTTCAALAAQPGWCTCTGPELPVPVGATGRRTPGVLFHGTADPLVSVQHTCTLDALMRARGNPVQTTLFDGGGHAAFPTLAARVWAYLSAYRLGP
jgi:poly(3-hydroxybutyrate) depolymerase